MSGLPNIWSHPEFIRRQFQISRLQTTIATISKTRDDLQVALHQSIFQQQALQNQARFQLQTLQNRLHLAMVESDMLKAERDGLVKQNGVLARECSELRSEVDYWKKLALGKQKAASPEDPEELCVSEPQGEKVDGDAHAGHGDSTDAKKENN